MIKEATFIPCEPFVSKVWDAHESRMRKAIIDGYHVAILEMATFEMPDLLTPIAVESGAKHGVIAGPHLQFLD